MMEVVLNVLMFLPICMVTSLVCTAVRLDDGERVLKPSLKMFVMLACGIAVFCVVIYAMCLIAGSEFSAVW
jgi:hypothetical protein